MFLPVLFIVCYITAVLAEAPYKQLNDGNKIPGIVLGTGRGTAEGVPYDEVRDAVLWAIEAGYRHIDTAAVYGDEPEVGQGIKEAVRKGLVKREQIFVTTKLMNHKHRKEQVVPALKESLGKLGLDYVDLYLIHLPVSAKAVYGSPDIVDYLETWEGMQEARELGLARSIGLSNFNSSQIERVLKYSKIPPAVNEVEVNPTLTQEPLVAYCQARNIVVMAYSPFGFLVSRNKPDAPPPRYDDPTLVAMAQKYNKTTGQIVLRYSIERGLIPIPKSTNKARLAENIDLFDFELTKEEVASISAFNANVRVKDYKWLEKFPYFPFDHVEE